MSKGKGGDAESEGRGEGEVRNEEGDRVVGEG